MNRTARRIGLIAGAAVVGVVVALVLLAQPGSVGAQSALQRSVEDALLTALAEAGVPVEIIAPYPSDDFPEAYTAVCRSVSGSDPANFGLAFLQASALANQGLPIRSLHLLCIDSSGATAFEGTLRVDTGQHAPGPLNAEEALSALQSDLNSAVAEAVLSSLVVGIEPAGVSITQSISGTLAQIRLAATDLATAKSATNDGLIQEVVESCVSGGTNPVANTVRVLVETPAGNVVVDYLKDLDTGDFFVYSDPEIGSDWIDVYGPFKHF
jgi:hypothetical protein